MELCLVGDDQTLIKFVSDTVARAGVDCAVARVLTTVSAESEIRDLASRGLLIVLYCSRSFTTEDLAAIRLLAAIRSDRVRLVAVGSVSDPNLILRIIRNGAVDVLDVNQRFEQELGAVVERLKSVPTEAPASARLYSVVGTVGGVGASFLACNLSVAMAQSGQNCRLLDLHLRGGDQAKLLQAAPRHNLASLAPKFQHLDAAMFEQSLSEHPTGLRLLPGPEPFSDFRQCTPQLVQKVIQLARAGCSHVIVDLEDAEHAEQARTLASSDQTILVLRPDLISLYRTQRTLEFFKQSQVPLDRVLLVANRVGQPGQLSLRRMAEVLEMPINCQIPEDVSAVNESFNLGIPLVQSKPSAKISRAITSLANQLLGIEPARAGAAWLARMAASLSFAGPKPAVLEVTPNVRLG